MEENLKKIQQDIKKLDSYRVITTEELSTFLNDVANVLAQYRSATGKINQETKDTLNLIVKQRIETYLWYRFLSQIVPPNRRDCRRHQKGLFFYR